MTFPLTAWYYYEILVYSILLNMLVLPLLGIVLIGGACDICVRRDRHSGSSYGWDIWRTAGVCSLSCAKGRGGFTDIY